MADDFDINDLPEHLWFSSGDDPSDALSETALKALTYHSALYDPNIRLSAVAVDRGAVIQMWREIAENKADPNDILAWATSVARAICKTVIDYPGARSPSEKSRDLAMKAIGLAGRKDENWEAREALIEFLDKHRFIRRVSPAPDKMPANPSRSECLAYMRDKGFFVGKTNKVAGLAIDRLIGEIGAREKDQA